MFLYLHCYIAAIKTNLKTLSKLQVNVCMRISLKSLHVKFLWCNMMSVNWRGEDGSIVSNYTTV